MTEMLPFTDVQQFFTRANYRPSLAYLFVKFLQPEATFALKKRLATGFRCGPREGSLQRSHSRGHFVAAKDRERKAWNGEMRRERRITPLPATSSRIRHMSVVGRRSIFYRTILPSITEFFGSHGSAYTRISADAEMA